MKETMHKCRLVWKMQQDAKKNNIKRPTSWGQAFDSEFVNYGDSEYFWATNKEYANPIFFCPACGLDLRTLLKK